MQDGPRAHPTTQRASPRPPSWSTPGFGHAASDVRARTALLDLDGSGWTTWTSFPPTPALAFLPPGGNLFHNMVSPLEREVPPAARGTRSHSPTHQASNRHRRRGGNEAIWVCRRVSVASLPAGLPVPPTEPTGTERNASQSHRSSTVVCVPATVCGR